MRSIILFFIAATWGCSNPEHTFLQTSEVQLSDPIVTSDSMIFINSTDLDINHVTDKSELYYRIDSGSFQVMAKPATFKKSAKVIYFEKKKGYKNSDTLSLMIAKSNHVLRNADVSIQPLPNSKYSGSGAQSLIDLKKGSSDFSGSNNWLGFQEEKIEIRIALKKEVITESIKLSILDDPNSWIYSPNKVTIIGNNEIIGKANITPLPEKRRSSQGLIDISTTDQKYSILKIIIESMSEIPRGLPGAGNRPWLFIDEIILN